MDHLSNLWKRVSDACGEVLVLVILHLPLIIFTLICYLLSPEGFWQKLILVPVGIMFLFWQVRMWLSGRSGRD